MIFTTQNPGPPTPTRHCKECGAHWKQIDSRLSGTAECPECNTSYLLTADGKMFKAPEKI